jgi:hypothetical protein
MLMPTKFGTVGHMKKLPSAVIALTFVIAFAGIARTTIAQAPQKETFLQQAGFKVQTVTTARQQQLLRELPAGKICIVQHNGKSFYAFADVAHKQIFTGNAAQYQAYKEASRQASGLSIDPDPHGVRVNEFDGWGPGPLAPTDGY